MQCFNHVKVNFEKKNPILPFEKFPFLVLARNAIMLPHLIIHSSPHYLLREVVATGGSNVNKKNRVDHCARSRTSADAMSLDNF